MPDKSPNLPPTATIAVETIAVDTTTVACDGGVGAHGHPRVYLNLGHDGKIDCPYCGRRFVLTRKPQGHG